MNLQSIADEATKMFEELKEKRGEYLQLAEDCMAEMNRFQGEHRLALRLQAEQEAEKPIDKSNVIEVKPAKEKKNGQ